MSKANDLYMAGLEAAKATFTEPENTSTLEGKTLEAFNAGGFDPLDYLTFKSHAAGFRKVLRQLNTAKLPSETAAELAARTAKK